VQEQEHNHLVTQLRQLQAKELSPPVPVKQTAAKG